ncbi:MAG: hypothetical protein Q4C30_10015 [Bacteroidia bacterium]|nr:hypothetical protein [Bacteroidia bacterium]
MQKFILIVLSFLSLTSCLDECDLFLSTDRGYIAIDVMISTYATKQYAYVRKSFDHTVTEDSVNSYDWNYRNWLYFESVDCEIILIDEETKREYTYRREVDKRYTVEKYYVLDDFTAIVGRTYTVKVIYDGKVYQSTQTVRKAPKIDNVKFKPYETADEKEGKFRPFLYFADPSPSEIDYCIFYDRDHHSGDCSYFDRTGYHVGYVPMTIYSDEGVKSAEGGIECSIGIGAYENEKNTGVGYSFNFEVLSISKENYDFFVELEKQITTDGGVYTPTPVTPPTNFSGEKVMGQFIATDIQIYRFETSDDNIIK